MDEDKNTNDDLALRTIRVENLNSKVKDKHLTKLLPNSEWLESIERQSTSVALLRLSNKKYSPKILKKIRGEQVKGAIIRASLVRKQRIVDETAAGEQKRPKCKLIVRNLSDRCSDAALKEPFTEFGSVITSYIPMKDGKQAGFGFVLFDKEESATKAMVSLNGTKIMGRPIAIDYAFPKKEYLAKRILQTSSTKSPAVGTKRIKIENTTEGKPKPKRKQFDVKIEQDLKSEKLETVSDDDSDVLFKEERTPKQKPKKGRLNDVSDGRTLFVRNVPPESKDDCAELFGKYGKVKYCKFIPTKNKFRGSAFVKFYNKISADKCLEQSEVGDITLGGQKLSIAVALRKEELATLPPTPRATNEERQSDVGEGKTLFIRNIPFDCSEEDVSEKFEEFGDLEYCRLVTNKSTGEPKGTGFVKFTDAQKAKDCLEEAESTGVELDGRRLLVCVALAPGEVAQTTAASKSVKSDDDKMKQNLHLLYEGRIKPGSDTAKLLTTADMKKREKVELVKKNKLKNPNMFVSDRRLVVHNLPKTVTDEKFRQIFLDATDGKGKITESRVMRNMNPADAKHKGMSLGFGFIAFADPSDAMAALRTTNNNPKIFSNEKRLIVGFSIENRMALMAKKRRVEKSRLRLAEVQRRVTVKKDTTVVVKKSRAMKGEKRKLKRKGKDLPAQQKKKAKTKGESSSDDQKVGSKKTGPIKNRKRKSSTTPAANS